MNTYEKELYDFLVKPSNFQTAAEVAERYNWVRNEVIKEFWLEFEIQLKKRMNDEVPDWDAETSGELQEKYAKLGIWRKDWPGGNDVPVWLCFESLQGKDGNLFIGFSVAANDKNWDTKKIVAEVSKAEIAKRLTHVNEWWAFGKYLDYNFGNNRTLIMALPENRQSLMDELINLMIDLAAEIDKTIDIPKILKNSKR